MNAFRMEETTVKRANAVISAVFIVAALALFGIALKNRTASRAQPSSETGAKMPAEKTRQYQDLAGMRRIELAKDFASWTPGAKVDPEKTRTASLAVSGKIAKAYLTVEASAEGKPLTKYESVYLKFNDAGGHLFRPNSLPTPDNGMTSLLFPLNDVPTLPSVPYDESHRPESADLAALMQDGKTVKLTAFISSLRPALLDELAISYVCIEGSECGLAVR